MSRWILRILLSNPPGCETLSIITVSNAIATEKPHIAFFTSLRMSQSKIDQVIKVIQNI